MPVMLRSLLLAPVAWGAIAGAAFAQNAVPTDVLSRVDRGQVYFRVEDGARGDRRIHFVGIVDGTPDAVYRALTHVDRYSQVLPAYFLESSVRQRRRESEIALLRFRTHFPFPDRDVLNRYTFDPQNYEMTWERLGGSVKKNDGTVVVTPYKGKSLVDFRVTLDPGIPFLPRWIFEWVEAQVVPGVVGEINHVVHAEADSL